MIKCFKCLSKVTRGYKLCRSCSQKGKKFTKEHKMRIGRSNKGKIFTEEHKRKIGEKHKNKNISAETRIKMSSSAKERLSDPENNNFYNKKHTLENKMKMRLYRLGKKLINIGHKENCLCACCNAYIDGRTPLRDRIRSLYEYKSWRKSVFNRDNYICQKCGRKKCYVEAHHSKESFSAIFNKFLKEYDQFSPIEDKETLIRLAIKWKPFWDINNGETLCEGCHNLTKNKRTEKIKK